MTLNRISIPLPIPQDSIALAMVAASQYSSPDKSQQIRLNTLAVLVMNDFLNLLQVKTAVTLGDSWGKMAALMDTADLVLPDFGKLECRPVKGFVHLDALDVSQDSPKFVHVPAEVWDDRIGFVVIQIDEENHRAELLGFTVAVDTEAFAIADLQAMTALVDRLESLQPQMATSGIPAIRSKFQTLTHRVDQSVTRLGDWFAETLEAGWQSIERMTLAPAFAFRFREPAAAFGEAATFRICRGKVINLDVENALTRSNPRQVSLIVGIQPSTSPSGIPEHQVTLSFYPVNPDLSLPLFQAAVRDETGVVHYEGAVALGDEFLEFEFNCGGDESFDLVISSDEFQIVESFAV
jgi:hypothetical protein